MAEYYPLISRAVAGLRGAAPEARQAIYGRAKSALVAQLRGMQPPVPEEAIGKEIAALDEAVARIEAELVAAPPPTAGPAPSTSKPLEESKPAGTGTPPEVAPAPPPAAVAPSPPVPAPTPAPARSAAPPPVAPPRTEPAGGSSPVLPSTPRPSAVRPPAPPAKAAAGASARPERAVFERRAALPAARPITPRPAASPPVPQQPVVAQPAPATEAPSAEPQQAPADEPANAATGRPAPPPEMPRRPEPAAGGATPPRAEPAAQIPAPLPVAPTLRATDSGSLPNGGRSPAPVLRARSDEPDDIGASPIPDMLAGDIRPREEGIRPAIPRQTVRPPRDLRVWIVAVAALAAVMAIALTAWKLRDNPEELARTPVPAKQEPVPGKIVERAEGVADDTDPDTSPSTPAPAAPKATAPANAVASAPPAVQQPVGDQGIAVAYKAAILVAAPDTPEKVKTYVGTVVWRSESVTQGQEQPLGTEVRADIDVPEAKIQVVMEIRRNTEPQFPASHTIDLKFTVGAGSPIGNIKQIDVPRMRSEDAPTGEPLVGVPVTITTNYFLVGLTRGAAEQHNMEAIRTHGWFDIPMVLENGTPAKITFEKGTSGDRIIADALATWSRS